MRFLSDIAPLFINTMKDSTDSTDKQGRPTWQDWFE